MLHGALLCWGHRSFIVVHHRSAETGFKIQMLDSFDMFGPASAARWSVSIAAVDLTPDLTTVAAHASLTRRL